MGKVGLSGTFGLGAVLFLLVTQVLPAQSGGAEIRGRVLAQEGRQAVPQARLSLLRQGAGAPVEAASDAQGLFRFGQLGAGVYRLEARAEGYLPQIQEGIQLSADASLEFSFLLEAEQTTLREAEERGAGERNPNIFIRRVGLSALRDPLRRRGIEPTVLQFDAAVNNHGVDLGAPLREIEFVRTREVGRAFHGSLYESHQNSALNARPFFNVGPLRPSKRNQFGLNLGGPLLDNTLAFDTTLDFVRESGFVNGNVRVPLPDERVPLTADPEDAAIIAALLQAFPDEEPNLGGRRLNTNAIRRIRSTEWDFKLDYHPADSHRLAFQYSLFDYDEDPFELVIGQNPRTDVRPQSFALSHAHTWSPSSLMQSSFQFDRINAVLVPTERFQQLVAPLGLEQGPAIDFGGGNADISSIGPDRQFPRKRVQNRFSGSLDFSHQRGNHHWRFGGRTTRVQVNDLQSNDLRGSFVFSSAFGRSTVDNFLLGTPVKFTIAFGDLYRGFRTWENALYVQNSFQLRERFTLNLGLRYEVITAPVEVNGRIPFFYNTDKNNFGPQVGLAWASEEGSTAIRAGYGIAHGHIFPDIYQRIRYNAPAVRVIPIDDPDLSDPLKDVDAVEEAPTEVTRLSSDLSSQYSHQYNLLIQQRLPWRLFLEVGYVGNRTKGPFFPFVSNRARPVPGIPLTTATVQQRRPDPRFSRILTVANAGTFYYDALTVGLSRTLAADLGFSIRYVFGKALESATNFISTANRETGFRPGQDGVDVYADLKGPSAFDHRHILSVSYTYEFPFQQRPGLLGVLLAGWSVSGMTEYRSGNWFTVLSSSDGPGFGNVDGFGSDRVNIVDPSLLRSTIDDPDTSRSILRPELFNTSIPPGGRGNIPRSAFRADPINNTNLALTKIFQFSGGEQSLQVRSEFQNLFNHPHFAPPGDIFPSDFFGEIVDTENKGRVIQFSLRWNF